MGVDLSHTSSIATQETNKTGVMTPILTWVPTEGTAIEVVDSVKTGDEEGFPVYAKLYDSNGNELPQDTELAFQYKSATGEDRNTVTKKYKNISTYRSLSFVDQQNSEYIDRVKHVLEGEAERLVVRYIDELHVSIDSSKQIDWSQGSRLIVDPNAVNQLAGE